MSENVKRGIIAFIALVLGVSIGNSGETTPPTQEPVQCEVQTCEVEKARYNELLTIDNEGFGYCGEFATVTSEAFKAASEFDYETVNEKAEQIGDINEKTEAWSDKRSKFLGNE